jgi:hypothetical protein
MAIRRPLVIVNGGVKELPIGDSLDSSETPVLFAVPIAATNASGDPEVTFDSTGDVILALRREGEL